ncbi:V-type ATP synthase subunit B [Nitrosophilus alvini]|uniref:V-type ATP synthase subunit B n=1 Tax=Nitrosophilus alvini TaxID=2714855 RepID=UPI00190DC8B7|nr:V-type ATP synthase subunit B [Nitrosophilus alvini]
MFIEYKGALRIKGNLLFFETVEDVAYGEKVLIKYQGREIYGRVAAVGEKTTLIEILGTTYGIGVEGLRVKYSKEPFMIGVGRSMLGRIFDAFAEPIDAMGPVVIEDRLDISGSAYNPAKRVHPRDYVHTGISAIDGLNTLVKGQKLPIFALSGVSTDELVAQIVRQIGAAHKKSAVVFAAIGIKHENADFFIKNIMASGQYKNTAVFINRADEPSVNSLLLARSALTLAEYLAFEHGYDVVTVLYDMSNYCDALREISAKREEIPSRKGYPGYMYSDLATIYERAGIMKEKPGSLTQIPVLTMPDDDITHPIPDLTGYITEGQIVLDRGLHQMGIYPPINVLTSLSRLMNKGIDKVHQRESNQLYAAYSKAKRAQMLSSIVGEEEISETDKKYLEFGRAFEKEFISQGNYENRTLEETLDIGWKLLGMLPDIELTRLKPEDIKRYIDGKRKQQNGTS